MGQRVGLLDVAPALADHHAQFHFPVGLHRAARNLHVVVGADDRAGPFVEHHRLGRHGHAALGCVVGVVQADADELAHLAHAGTQAQVLLRRAGHQRQAVDVEAAQARQALGQQGRAGHVGDHAGKVAHATLGVQHAGLFLAGGAKAQEFHS
ncbi:hypothetical protein D9M69_641030 [compost metagenome]